MTNKPIAKHQGCLIFVEPGEGYFFAAGAYEEGYFPSIEDTQAAIEAYNAEKAEGESY